MSAGLRGTVRAPEWWDYKLVPLLTAFYATLAMLERPVASAWPAALALLLAIVPGAAYVSLVNDVADLDEDRAAGKANRMEGRSGPFRAAALALPLAAGILFLFLWRDDPLLFAAYLAAWIAFTLYSVPPFRLKARGLWGVLADASGAHLFPTLVAMLLAFRAAGSPVDPAWIAAGAAWALGYGLRGILWHQLSDRDNDRAAGVRTFAQRHPPAVAARLGLFLAFPLELAGLAALLWRLGSPLPALLLLFYLLLVALRVRLWKMRAVVVEPRPDYLILLHEYYDVFLPLAVLAACALRHPIDLVALAAHLLLFHRRPLDSALDIWKLAGRLAFEWRRRR
ncbi:MAG TPA: UbiA family prenyltransferase [Allosphingosinicella sp.]|nr:UbiA family prenyltransferase [Allosphingosinicella sp.]